MLPYVDDLLFIAQGKKATDAVAVALLFMIVIGVPFNWHKCKGGTKVEWVGYFVDLEQKSVASARSGLTGFATGSKLL